VTKTDGSILLTLKVKARNYISDLSSVLFLDDDILKNEFYADDCPKEIQIEGVVRYVSSRENNSDQITETSGPKIVDLYCYPNPFEDEINVIYKNTVPNLESVLVVTDALGKVIYRSLESFDKGINRLKLTDREIQGSGLFFVSISSNGKTVTKRVFKN